MALIPKKKKKEELAEEIKEVKESVEAEEIEEPTEEKSSLGDFLTDFNSRLNAVEASLYRLRTI